MKVKWIEYLFFFFLFYYWAQSWQSIAVALGMKVKQDALGKIRQNIQQLSTDRLIATVKWCAETAKWEQIQIYPYEINVLLLTVSWVSLGGNRTEASPEYFHRYLDHIQVLVSSTSFSIFLCSLLNQPDDNMLSHFCWCTFFPPMTKNSSTSRLCSKILMTKTSPSNRWSRISFLVN